MPEEIPPDDPFNPADAPDIPGAEIIPFRKSAGVGPAGIRTYEELIGNAAWMREVVQLILKGYSFKAIAEHYAIDYHTMMRCVGNINQYINSEIRARIGGWQAIEFERLESMSMRLMPHIISDGTVDGSQEAPNIKHLDAYVKLVTAKLNVLTLRGAFALPEESSGEQVQATEKAAVVKRYVDMADELMKKVAEAGYGSGVYVESEDDESDALLEERADNSASIEDAVILDARGAAEDAELDAKPGQWVDGKWVADA